MTFYFSFESLCGAKNKESDSLIRKRPSLGEFVLPLGWTETGGVGGMGMGGMGGYGGGY